MLLDETGAKRRIFGDICQVFLVKKVGDFNKNGI